MSCSSGCQTEREREAVRVRAVLFDLGYTLLDYPVGMPWREFLRHRLAEMCDTVCSLARVRPMDPREFATRMGEVIGGKEARALEHGGRSWHFTDRLRKGLTAVDATYSDAVIERITNEFLDPVRSRVRSYPETVQVLEALRAAGVAQAIISNSPWDAPGRLTREDMERSGIADYFNVAVISGDVPWRKPNPEFMWAAARELEVGPVDCLVVGDSLRADIGGARAAGMRSVWVNREQQEAPAGSPTPDYTLSSLDEMLAGPLGL